MKSKAILRNFLVLAASSLLAISSAQADSGNWTYDGTTASSLLWSEATSWSSDPTVPGTTAGDVITFANNITAARTITIDTDSRTVGQLTIGDSDNTHFFTLAAIGGTGLIFDNTGSGATITATNATLATLTTARDTISAPITLADNLAVSVAGTYSGGVTSKGYFGITGNIGESGGVRSITKSGDGTLVLIGNNTYSGGFTLNAGTVQATANPNEVNNSYTGFGTGTLTINGGTVATRSAGSFTTTNDSVWNGNFSLYRGQTGTATWNHAGDVTLGGNVSVTQPNNFFNLNVSGDIGETDGPRGLTFAIATITLSGNNTYTGGTSVTAGTIQFGKPVAMPATGTVAMSSGTTLSVNAGGNGEFTNATSGAGSIGGLLEASAIGGQGAPVTWAGTARLGIDTTNATGGSFPYSGIIENRGSSMGILKTGTGNLVLDQASTYTGATTVTQGNLVAGSNAPSGAAGAFGNATSEISLGVALSNNDAGLLIGGAFNVERNVRLLTNNNSDSGTRVLTIGGNTADNSEFSGKIFLGTTNQAGRGVTLTAASGGQVTFSGVIQNPTGMDATNYTVTKAGTGTVVLSNSNTYDRATLITEGTLAITGATQATNSITFTGGSLGLNTGVTVTAANAAVDLTNGTITVTGSTGASSYTLLTAASITGTPALAAPVPGYELQVVDGATDELRLVKTGGASPYDTWSGNQPFDGDLNDDGVSNGLAFLLGASGPNVNALDKLPVVTQTGGDLKLTFDMLPSAARGGAQVFVEHSDDLGTWSTGTPVPDATGGTAPVTFIVNDSDLDDPENPLDVEVTISASEAAAGKLFGRLKAVNP